MERPTFLKGGPSPRIRALANQDRLMRRELAASVGVSSRSRRFGSRLDLGIDPSDDSPGSVSSRPIAAPAQQLRATAFLEQAWIGS